jgi:ABC-type metal ion transport system substrate-binding protein
MLNFQLLQLKNQVFNQQELKRNAFQELVYLKDDLKRQELMAEQSLKKLKDDLQY